MNIVVFIAVSQGGCVDRIMSGIAVELVDAGRIAILHVGFGREREVVPPIDRGKPVQSESERSIHLGASARAYLDHIDDISARKQ